MEEDLRNLTLKRRREFIRTTHWRVLDEPNKYNLSNSSDIYKIFMVPFNNDKMTLREVAQVKCVYCQKVINLNDSLSSSNARSHMEKIHKNADAWVAISTSMYIRKF